MGLGAEDDVGVFGVDVHEDGRDGRELRLQLGGQLRAVGELRAGADDTDHDLPAVGTAPQEDVAHKAFAGGLIVGLDVVDDAVGAPGVKADAGGTVFVPAHRELHLVAIAVHFGGGQGVQNRHIQPANAAEDVGHALLLGPQLGGVVQRPQSLTMRTSASSPGAVPGTNTASPSGECATPLPSLESRSMVSVST